METGWTLTEIRNLPYDLKKMYLEFIKVKREKEQKDTEDKLEEIRKKAKVSSGEKDLQFVNAEDYDNFSKVK